MVFHGVDIPVNLSVHRLMNVWAVSPFWLLPIKLPWIFVYRFLCRWIPWQLSGKASACNAGDMSSIPGSRRSLEEDMATHSSILAWRIHGQRSLTGYSPWGHKESDMTEHTCASHVCTHISFSMWTWIFISLEEMPRSLISGLCISVDRDVLKPKCEHIG